jgi:hypothetical protein
MACSDWLDICILRILWPEVPQILPPMDPELINFAGDIGLGANARGGTSN